MNKAFKLKAAISAALAALTAFWGWFGWLLVLWVACMVIDFASGTAVACKGRAWASNKARDGIWHKAGMILVVAVALIADGLIGLILCNIPSIALPFQYSVLIAPVVIVWYTLTELGSIVENARDLGAPVPAWLVRFLDAAKSAADAAVEMGESHEGN